MGKVLDNGKCEFDVSIDYIINCLPPPMIEFICDNEIIVDVGDEAQIMISDYPKMQIDKQIIVDYFTNCSGHDASTDEKLADLLNIGYMRLVDEFTGFEDYLERNHIKLDFENCIVNKDELLKEITRQLDEDFDFEEDKGTLYRIIFPSEDELQNGVDALTEQGCYFDLDGGDRLMVYRKGLRCLSDAGIDYEEVASY